MSVLVDLIEAHDLRHRRERGNAASSVHCSGITGCARRAYYDLRGFAGEAPITDPRWGRDAQAGEALHATYQRKLLQLGLVADTTGVLEYMGYRSPEQVSASWEARHLPLPGKAIELPLPRNPFNLGGRVDLVLDLPPDYAEQHQLLPGLCIAELKTVSQKNYVPSGRAWKLPSYRAQAQCYMHLTGIPQAIILILNRNSSELDPLIVEYDAEEAAEHIAKAARIWQAYLAAQLPAPERSRLCEYCPHFWSCSEEKN